MSNTEEMTLSTLIEALVADMRDTWATAAELSFDNKRFKVRVTVKVSELNND